MDAIAVCDFEESTILESSIKAARRIREGLIGRNLFNLGIWEGCPECYQTGIVCKLNVRR
jgi:hypothetical protein